MTSTLTLTIPRNLWMTSNRPVIHRGHRARIIRDLHKAAALAAHHQDLAQHLRPQHLTWHIAYPKGTGWQHGDAANAHPTCKAILDALVPAWIPGDGPTWVHSETYRRTANSDTREHLVTLQLDKCGDVVGSDA